MGVNVSLHNLSVWVEAKILLVDDQEANLLFLQRLLEQAGYRHIEKTTKGKEALSLFDHDEPDLVILDLHMPGMTGYEVLFEIRRKSSKSDQVPVLVFTADSTPAARVKALELGASDFLTKPCDATEILLRVKNFLYSRQVCRALKDQADELELKVLERTEDLIDSQAEVLERLGRAAEYRDNETGAHVMRMSLYCALLGRAAGLPPADCEMLTMASTLHDIGKIGVPDSILLKTGKLTAEERQLIENHVNIGADILEGARSELLRHAREIVLTHHEKWDGTGYPRGLKGDEIPLFGRIAAIADVFDALTSKRPYKEAWPVDKAVEEINRGAGAQFDPELVRLFNEVLPEFTSVIEGPEEPFGQKAA
jgi:putative two-component system response regulator